MFYISFYFSLQAVNKMGGRVEAGQRTTCILEIGDQGIKMVDKSKPGVGVNHITPASI